jgi:hypothetical protein
VAALVYKVCAESCRQADKVRRGSSNQKNGCVVLCSDHLVANRERVGTDFLLPMGAWCIRNRNEDHAEDHAEEQRVEVSD